MGFAIIAFIQARALGPTTMATNPNTINRFQQLNHIILRVKPNGCPFASITKWLFKPLIRCFPENPTWSCASFSI